MGTNKDLRLRKVSTKERVHIIGVPHCGSRGFGSEDNSGGEDEAGNIEYICM